MKKIKILKQKCKDMVSLIKENSLLNRTSKTQEQKDNYWAWKREKGIMYTDLSKEYRHMHIAYCLLKGRKYEEVENKVREGNSPNWSKIEQIMKEYREVDDISCTEVISNECK